MTPTEAVKALLELRRTDREIAMLLAGLCDSKGYPNIFAFADAEPAEIVKLAEEMQSMVDQTLDNVDSHRKVAPPSKD